MIRENPTTQEMYATHFARLTAQDTSNGAAWTSRLRQEAFACFAALGFPNTREEAWKYTNVTPIAKMPFTPAAETGVDVRQAVLAQASVVHLAGPRLVFVNGAYMPVLSSLEALPPGVIVRSLAQALSLCRPQIEPHLTRYACFRQHPFVALNTAFMQDGAFVYVPPGTVVEMPIHLVFLSTVDRLATVAYPRNLLVLEHGSQAQFVEQYVGGEDDVYLTNAVTEVVTGAHAVLDHYRLQQESSAAFHMARLQIHQERSSTVTSHTLTLGGALVRNEVQAILDGEGSACTLNGLFYAAGQQHVDNQTRVEHIKPHCTSRELYKGILGGKGRGVFNGAIYVHNHAQHTNAQQTNKNLLLSPDAWIDTKPQLEIYNNDVKCGHGSTIGRLDDMALFYLRSRGIGAEEARQLLIAAFASEMLDRITIAPLQAALHDIVRRWFPSLSRKTQERRRYASGACSSPSWQLRSTAPAL